MNLGTPDKPLLIGTREDLLDGIGLFFNPKLYVSNKMKGDSKMKMKKAGGPKKGSHQAYTPDPNISGSVAPAKKKGASQAHKHGGHHSPAKPE